MKYAILALLATAFAAVGCSSGGSACAGFKAAYNTLTSTCLPAPNPDAGTVAVDGGASVTCDSVYNGSSCTDADRKAADAEAVCAKAIPACTTNDGSKAAGLLSAIVACTADAGLSQACATALATVTY